MMCVLQVVRESLRDASVLSLIAHCKATLRQLNLSQSNLSELAYSAIARRLPLLEDLELCNCNIPSITPSTIVKEAPQLRRLVFRGAVFVGLHRTPVFSCVCSCRRLLFVICFVIFLTQTHTHARTRTRMHTHADVSTPLSLQLARNIPERTALTHLDVSSCTLERLFLADALALFPNLQDLRIARTTAFEIGGRTTIGTCVVVVCCGCCNCCSSLRCSSLLFLLLSFVVALSDRFSMCAGVRFRVNMWLHTASLPRRSLVLSSHRYNRPHTQTKQIFARKQSQMHR